MMTEYLPGVLAAGLNLLATAVFYSGCPNQQWFGQRPIRFYPATLISIILLALSWWQLDLMMSGLSAAFTVLTFQMLMLGIVPFLTRFPSPRNNLKGFKSWLVRGESYATHRPQWTLKVVGSVLVGFPLALFISSLLGFSADAEIPLDIRSQFVMWMITPLWLLPLSLIFFLQRPWRAFLFMSAATGLAYALLTLVR